MHLTLIFIKANQVEQENNFYLIKCNSLYI